MRENIQKEGQFQDSMDVFRNEKSAQLKAVKFRPFSSLKKKKEKSKQLQFICFVRLIQQQETCHNTEL